MRALFLLLLASIAAVSAGQRCKCNSVVGPEADPTSLNNAAQQIFSISITLLDGETAIPHHIAIISGAMFEALLFATGSRTRFTDIELDIGDLTVDQVVGYAGYAALTQIFASNPDKRIALNEAVGQIGFGNRQLRNRIGRPFAQTLARMYPLNIPPPEYTPPNQPSSTANAQCDNIADPDGWQPLCVTPPTGGPCVVQTVPFLPFVNASLITAGGEQSVDELIENVPSPNIFLKNLRRYPETDTPFTRDYNSVLNTSAKLDDRRKIIAEIFAPNAALGVYRLTLDEAATRNLDLRRSARLFFTMAAATRDGIVGSSTVKLIYSTIRPITVLQCGLRTRDITVWQGPYMGVGKFRSSKVRNFRPYIQTPPFPGYISGHTTVAGAAARVLTRFFAARGPRGANCFVVPPGGSVIEGRKEEGEEGFIRGVTNVPNTGRRSVGFTPATETTICWNTFNEYAALVSRSRLFGGVHTPIENREGLRLGRRAGGRAFTFVQRRTP